MIELLAAMFIVMNSITIAIKNRKIVNMNAKNTVRRSLASFKIFSLFSICIIHFPIPDYQRPKPSYKSLPIPEMSYYYPISYKLSNFAFIELSCVIFKFSIELDNWLSDAAYKQHKPSFDVLSIKSCIYNDFQEEFILLDYMDCFFCYAFICLWVPN